jgi:hypothetical protein
MSSSTPINRGLPLVPLHCNHTSSEQFPGMAHNLDHLGTYIDLKQVHSALPMLVVVVPESSVIPVGVPAAIENTSLAPSTSSNALNAAAPSFEPSPPTSILCKQNLPPSLFLFPLHALSSTHFKWTHKWHCTLNLSDASRQLMLSSIHLSHFDLLPEAN